MKIITALFLLILPFLTMAQGIDFTHSDIQQAIKLAKKQGQLVFVDFTASWCQPCKSMDAEVFRDPIIGEKMNAFFVCVRLDFNDAAVKSIASSYGFSSIPVTLCLDTLGKVLSNTLGYGNKKHTEQQLDYMISLHTKGKKYMQFEKAYKKIPEPNQAIFASYLGNRRNYGVRNTSLLNDYWKKLSPQDLEIDSIQTFFADCNTDLKGDIFEYILKNKSNILIRNRLAALIMFNLQVAIKDEDKSLLKETQKANSRIIDDPSVAEVENEQLSFDFFLKTQNEKQFHKTVLNFLKKYKAQPSDLVNTKIKKLKEQYTSGLIKNKKYVAEFESVFKDQ